MKKLSLFLILSLATMSLLLLNGCARDSNPHTFDCIKQEVLGIVAASGDHEVGNKLLSYYVSKGFITPEQALMIMDIYNGGNNKK